MVSDLNKVKSISAEEYEQEMIVDETIHDEGRLVMLPVNKLHPHPDNPRKKLGDLDELADSIKAKGIMQNLTVVPKKDVRGEYTIIIGHRRHAAAKKARLYEVPCVVVDMDEQEQIATMLLENIQRSDLTAYEQAKGFQMMMDFGDSVSQIVEKTGFSESTVRRRLKMAELDEKTLEKVSVRQLSLGDFDKLSEIENIDVRNKVLADIGTNNFNSSLKSALEDQKRAGVLARMREAFNAAGLYEIPRSDYTKHSYQTSISSENDIDKAIARAKEYGAVGYYCSYSTCFYMMSKKEKASAQKNDAKLEREKAERERKARCERLGDAFKRAFEMRRDFVETYSKQKAVLNLHKIVAFLACTGFNEDLGRDISKEKFETMLFGRECEISDYEELCDFIEPTEAAKATLIAVWLLADAEFHCFDYYGKFDNCEPLNMIYEFLESLGYEMSDEERELITGESELYKKD